MSKLFESSVPEMHVEDIKAGLRKKGYTLTALAETLGVTTGTVSGVIKKRRSRYVEAAVAAALCIPVSRIWPKRYPKRKRA